MMLRGDPFRALISRNGMFIVSLVILHDRHS